MILQTQFIVAGLNSLRVRTWLRTQLVSSDGSCVPTQISRGTGCIWGCGRVQLLETQIS